MVADPKSNLIISSLDVVLNGKQLKKVKFFLKNNNADQLKCQDVEMGFAFAHLLNNNWILQTFLTL